jgi:hypothetical protein
MVIKNIRYLGKEKQKKERNRKKNGWMMEGKPKKLNDGENLNKNNR